MSLDEIFNDKRLKWIADEWAKNSLDLAHWAMRRLVNRTDVWGQYSVRNTKFGKKISAVTLPVADLRSKNTDMVTLDKLERHFKGRKAGHLIGLHCVSQNETCRWFAIDLDVHEETNALEQSDNNFNAACAWYWRLREASLDPVVLSSNGKGGIHLVCLLDGFYPLADVFGFLSNIVADYQAYGLVTKPEIFPSSEKSEHLGKWLRLPGRHHTHNHFTKIWSDDSEYDDEEVWLEGKDAIDCLMNLRPMPLPDSAQVVESFTDKLPEHERKKAMVCVDLDGTIAEYDVWRGLEHIGNPIEGAREFLAGLMEFSKVIIYTSRCNPDRVEAVEVGILQRLVIDWLEDNSMPYSEVYVGQGKPIAHAFVDDRAVNCSPQKSDLSTETYKDATGQIRRLCNL